MESSLARDLMLRHLKTVLPVAYKLQESCVVTKVLDQLCNGRQVSAMIFDISERDLLELTMGKVVQIKPGDRTGIRKRGFCVQKATGMICNRTYLCLVMAVNLMISVLFKKGLMGHSNLHMCMQNTFQA